jgi:photosystem II stability/assembly factor-like uncharacterized protein
LAAHPTDPDVLYAGAWLTSEGADLLYRSDDGGATWQPAADGLPTDLPINSGVTDLLLDPTDPDTLYVALRLRGVWRSDDGGATWNHVVQGALRADADVVALALDAGPPATLYALTTEGLVALNGSGGWKTMKRGLPNADSVVYNDIAVDPTDGGTVYVATNPTGLFRTTNGGRNWRARNEDLPGGTRNVRGITVSPSGELFISLRGTGLLRSSNDGATWTLSQTGITFTNTLFGTISAPVFDPNQPEVALAFNSDGIFRSTDGGLNWQRFGTGMSVTTVVTALTFAPARPGVALAGSAISGVWLADEEDDTEPPPPPPAQRLFVPMVRR